MSDYIKRDEALSVLRGEAVKKYPSTCAMGLSAAATEVGKIPAADVVEVVRCKDCKYFCPYDGEEHKGDCAELVGLESCVYEDDFCSYGAKMDGKGEGE